MACRVRLMNSILSRFIPRPNLLHRGVITQRVCWLQTNTGDGKTIDTFSGVYVQNDRKLRTRIKCESTKTPTYKMQKIDDKIPNYICRRFGQIFALSHFMAQAAVSESRWKASNNCLPSVVGSIGIVVTQNAYSYLECVGLLVIW